MPTPGLYSTTFAKARGIGLRAPGYFAVAETARFRVSQRHRRWNAARQSMVIIAFAALLNCLWTSVTHPAALQFTIVAMATLTAIAAAGYTAITRHRRRPSDRTVLAVLVGIDIVAVWLTLGRAQFGVVAFGDLLLLPVIVAFVAQWPTRFHFGWLIVHVAITLGYALLTPQVAQIQREGIVLVLAVSTALSAFGHVVGLRSRVLNFVQIAEISALNRQARRDKAHLSRLNAILAETAITDELTGLKNRLGLKLDLAIIRARIKRHGEQYALLLADLDRFKAINDQLGHVAGDGFLRQVAGSLRTATRPEDGVYRYGGEEFALLVRVDSPADAALVAERVRSKVAALAIAHPDNSPHEVVTLSVGAATVGASDLQADDDTLFRRADEALYRAKSEGRNRAQISLAPAPYPAQLEKLRATDQLQAATVT